jgi:hypothetical protein
LRAPSLLSKCDLTLYLFEDQNVLSGILLYNAALFSESTIRQFLKSFRLVLDSMGNDLEAALQDLPWFTSQELDVIKKEFSEVLE